MRRMVSDRQSLTGKIFGGFKVGSKLKGDRHVIEPLNRDRCESPPWKAWSRKRGHGFGLSVGGHQQPTSKMEFRPEVWVASHFRLSTNIKVQIAGATPIHHPPGRSPSSTNARWRLCNSGPHRSGRAVAGAGHEL